MISQSLQISAGLNNDSAATLTRTLSAVKGVDSVAFAPGSSRFNVVFDEDQTSIQELVATLERAGYPVQTAKARHGEGSCCGSCGG